jgi:hypothetical protein
MTDKLDNVVGKHNDDDDDGDDNVKSKSPIGKIKFLDRHTHDAIDAAAAAHAATSTASDRDDDASRSSSSVESSEEGEVLAFSGEARVFFQARHHRSATQIVPGSTATSSQDTYLRVAVVHSADADGKYRSELRIFCAARDHVGGVGEPPVLLVDPPIPLRHFYAAKVPGSHSSAALFLSNDPRRLRRYVWRFEFANRAVRQPPSRYLQFARSGRVARKSMVRRPTLGMAKRALRMKPVTTEAGDRGEDGGGVGGGSGTANARARDAFAVHLSALDELLRESDEAADGFVECVNSFNDAAWEEEEDERVRCEVSSGGGAAANTAGGARRRKRTKPPPPYWGGGYNSHARPTRATADEADDDDSEDNAYSDSDHSEDEDDELMNYDDDNDDETLFDKVTVSTEQALETLYNHIVK